MTVSQTPDPIIKAWQQMLVDAAKADGLPDPLPVYHADGLGGHETQDAIIAFQKRHPPLAITGQFDAATRAALNPVAAAHISSAEVAILLAGLSHLPFIPQSVKDLLMFPTLLQIVIGLVPGIPDDFAAVEKEITEICSTDSGVAKVRSFVAFVRSALNVAEGVLNKVDPTGVTPASVPIPAAVAALAPVKS